MTKAESKGKITVPVTKKQSPTTPTPEDDSSSNYESANSELSDASDTHSSSNESDYDEMTKTRKLAAKSQGSKKRKTAEATEFASILSSILSQDARDTRAPIMAKDKTRENQIKEEILDYRTRKALVAEKRLLLSKDRVIPSMQGFDYERKLRKVATKGVIKLFNVVKAQQTELTEINQVQNIKTEKVADMSKSKFLDLLKAKPKQQAN
ncbi:pre-60S ribosomal particles component [Coemansia sp. Benny D115]|nr:pre-60S ribosomal particles component [Coemansia sp. Benny D115]